VAPAGHGPAQGVWWLMEDPTEDPGLRPAGTAEEPVGEEPVGEPGAAGLAGGQRRPATGEPRVDAALVRLDELEELPVTEHRAVFEDVHRRLRDVLGELDAGQTPAAGQAAAGQAAAGRGAAYPARPGRPGR
jgi:hypothetical protein